MVQAGRVEKYLVEKIRDEGAIQMNLIDAG